MSEGLNFLHEFFTEKKYEIENITVTLDERPSFDIKNEDYRFRVKIVEVVDEIDIYYRDIAVEDHHKQAKHQKPHLQFKLHADSVGTIYIFLPIQSIKDYKKYILSFIDIIGDILINIDSQNNELQTNFMIMESFKKIQGMSENIKTLIKNQYDTEDLKLITFKKDEKNLDLEDIKKIKKIPQISPFFEKI